MKLYNCLLLLLVAYFIPSVTSQPTPSEDFPHHVILDQFEDVWLYWKIDEIYVTFEMHGRTTGWVGVGISPNGGMIGADIFVGWVKDGVATVTDRHGLTENRYPPKDEEQDLTFLGGDERDGWTRIKFQRQIAGCEQQFDLPLTTSTTKIIWALGFADPLGDDIASFDYHGGALGNRGTKSVLILEASGGNAATEEEDTEFEDFLNDAAEIPALETFYNCKLFEFPRPSSKRHIVKVEPIIEPGNENTVHHMVIYQCRRSPQDLSNVNRSHECYVRNMPDDFRACDLIIHAWAIGGDTFYFPEKAGLAIGTDDGPRYLLLEIHYDNPTLRSGIVDSSGIRMFHTGQLREYDAGVLEVGRIVFPFSFLIPPNAESFLTHGECPSSCLGPAMNHVGRNDIRVFGALLHTHLLGRAITLRHIAANGTTELPYLTQDSSYDFNYQEIKVFPQEVSVKQNESLQVVCSYNSMGKENFTTGGISTQEEMCFAFVYYYPKIPVTGCETGPFLSELYKFFGVSNFTFLTNDFLRSSLNNVKILEPERLENQGLGDVINSMEWDQTLAEEFSKFDQHLVRSHRCVSPVKLPVSRFGNPPNVTQPYQPPVAQCIKSTQPPITTTSSAQLLRGSFLLVVASIIGLTVLQ